MILEYFSVGTLQIIIFLVGLFIGLYFYASKIFYRIVIKTGTPIFGTIFIAYKFYKAPYSDIHKAISEINSVIRNKNKQTIVIYYDDPMKIENIHQRFIIGLILNDENLNIDEISQKSLKKYGYIMTTISKINNAVLTQYPCCTVLSSWLGKMLVYPKLKAFIKVKIYLFIFVSSLKLA